MDKLDTISRKKERYVSNIFEVIEGFSDFYYFSLFSYTINACILKNKRGMWLIVYDQVLYYTMCNPKTMKIMKNNKSR